MEVEEKNEKGKGKGIIVLVSLLILIIIGLIGYICYDKGIVFSKVENEVKESKTKSSKDKENEQEESNVNGGVGNEVTIKELDLSKCLNTNNISYRNSSDVEGDYGLSMNINPDKKSIVLSIDWNKFGPLSNASAWSSSVENYQITGFSKNIRSTFVGDLGQDAMGITLFYLMDDGTVEYTPMFNSKYDSQNNLYHEMNYTFDYAADGRATRQYFITKGVISGVSDVIKLYNVDASSGYGWRTTIGAKADGSFYDLGNVISK